MSLSLTAEKSIILVGMFLATICFGMLPIKLVIWNRTNSIRDRPNWLKTAISLANCFSGGVFVAACLLDLFPDVRESIDKVLDELENIYHTTIDYPVAEFIIVFGFLLVLIIEQIVLELKDYFKRPRAVVSVNAEEDESSETDNLLPQIPNYGAVEARQLNGSGNSVDHHEHNHLMFEEHSSLRSLILLLALTFHSLFEGMAIGLQSEYGQLISIFVAVIIHKAIMAFSLGLNLAQSHGMTVKYFTVANLIFSLASPIGMAIGIAVSDLQQSVPRDVANGVLQGIAGGTFLYITFFEVLPHEFMSHKMRLPKVLCVLVGYSCICALLFITH